MKMTIIMMMMIMMLKMIIPLTQSIFKLGPPDFAWKWIQIISKIYDDDDDNHLDLLGYKLGPPNFVWKYIFIISNR